MRDVVAVAIIVGFFLLCVAYVAWCDRIIGRDPDDLRDVDVDEIGEPAPVPWADTDGDRERVGFEAEAFRS